MSILKKAQDAVNSVPESLRCNISDGYHKFYELYEHRIDLYVTLCKVLSKKGKLTIWRSETHSDGSVMYKWFLLGIGTRKGSQITYHLPITKWKDTEFAKTIKKAPKFDGHTSEDVLVRLSKIS